MAGEQAPQASKFDARAVLAGAIEMDGSLGPQYNYFYNYSPTNMAYLWLQGAREIVGRMVHWNNVNRRVIKGSRAYEIIRPVFRQIIPMDTPDGQPGEPEQVLTGFVPSRYIFTLSQTEGEPLPPKPTPGWDVYQMLGKFGISLVPFDSQSGNLQGYARGLEIAVSPIAADRLKTIVHEAGHIALGHTLGHHLENEDWHRGILEFQAEAASYVVLSLIGALDDQTATYMRGYMHHYLEDEQPPEKACRQVLTVSDRIYRAGLLAVTQEDPSES